MHLNLFKVQKRVEFQSLEVLKAGGESIIKGGRWKKIQEFEDSDFGIFARRRE
jgi:hypothetical protein